MRIAALFSAVVLLTVAWSVQAQSGMIALATNPPVNAFVAAAEEAHFQCSTLALSYWDELQLASYGKGDPATKRRDVASCVSRNADAPRDKLVSALKYLEGKPGSSKALKEMYLKWTVMLGALTPSYGETFKANSERTEKANQDFKASQKALELELQLGT